MIAIRTPDNIDIRYDFYEKKLKISKMDKHLWMDSKDIILREENLEWLIEALEKMKDVRDKRWHECKY